MRSRGAAGAEAVRVRAVRRPRPRSGSRPGPRRRCTGGSGWRGFRRRCGRTGARSRRRWRMGAPPRWVQLRDLRGDLHTHTDLTDGLASRWRRWPRPRRGAGLRLLRGDRPRAEPVDAADDGREDAGPARAGPRPGPEARGHAPPARHRAQHRPGRRRRLARGVPGGVRPLRRVDPLALRGRGRRGPGGWSGPARTRRHVIGHPTTRKIGQRPPVEVEFGEFPGLRAHRDRAGDQRLAAAARPAV